ncbi:MAG: hypothetical protein EOM50_23915, partial [Erysipelotrichia bacterium]|nr:hypothetical protein [Erysipelotrichia bacterium]
MKFNFKIQQYQTDAVHSIIRIFTGQRKHDRTIYTRDLGYTKDPDQMSFSTNTEDDIDLSDDTGFKNEQIELSDEALLKNIHEIQTLNNIK